MQERHDFEEPGFFFFQAVSAKAFKAQGLKFVVYDFFNPSSRTAFKPMTMPSAFVKVSDDF